jgi:hypothetical protein
MGFLYAARGGKNVSNGVRLEVVTGATRRLRTHLGIVERRDEDDRGGLTAESLFLNSSPDIPSNWMPEDFALTLREVAKSAPTSRRRARSQTSRASARRIASSSSAFGAL